MVQLPAVNTPQFTWVKNRLPQDAQPVPPIFQPEIIADAVTWVTDHYRRQLWVGNSTVTVIAGNKVAPGLGDYYLAKTGFKSQQTGEKKQPNQPDNLYSPVDDEKDYGAHGAFDNQARGVSVQFWADKHRNWLALGALALTAMSIAVLKKVA
jgi:hypothetical protein